MYNILKKILEKLKIKKGANRRSSSKMNVKDISEMSSEEKKEYIYKLCEVITGKPFVERNDEEEEIEEAFKLVRRMFLNLVQEGFFIHIDALIKNPDLKDKQDDFVLSKKLCREMTEYADYFEGKTIQDLREEAIGVMFSLINQQVQREKDPKKKEALKENLKWAGAVFLSTLDTLFKK